MKNSIALSITIMGSMSCGLVVLSEGDKDSIHTENVAPKSDDGTTVIGSLKASKTKTQVLKASQSSSIAGAFVSFPPGSLVVDSEITITPGVGLTGDSLDPLGLPSEVSYAGTAVTVSSNQSQDAATPFTLQIALSPETALQAGHLIIVYQAEKFGESGKEVHGALPSSQLLVEDSKVQFTTKYFGTYQPGYLAIDLTSAVEVESTVPTTEATTIWRKISSSNGPSPRMLHKAAWVSNRMFVWGGQTSLDVVENTGAHYDPATDTWSSVTTTNGPSARIYHTLSVNDSQVTVFGGSNSDGSIGEKSGGIYDMEKGEWVSAIGSSLSTHRRHTAVHTKFALLIFGGAESDPEALAEVYDFNTGTWSNIQKGDFLDYRIGASGVWTGSAFIVFGGEDKFGAVKNQGAFYAGGNWSQINNEDAITGRKDAAAFLISGKMVIFGGMDDQNVQLKDGGIYDLDQDSWKVISPPSDLQGTQHLVTSTGEKLLLIAGDTEWRSAWLFDVDQHQWTKSLAVNEGQGLTTATGASIVWAQDRAIIFGGCFEVSATGCTTYSGNGYYVMP